MAETKNLRRRLVKVAGSSLVILFALFLIEYGILQTPWAKERLANAAESVFSEDGQRQLEIEEISGAGLANVVLENVSMSDTSGVWLELRKARIDWHPLSLLLGTLSIDVVETQGLHVIRPPRSESSEPFRLPKVPTLPLDIVIGRFTLLETVLESAFAGDRRELDGDGRLNVRAQAGFDVTFKAVEQGSTEPLARIEGTYDRPNGSLFLDAALKEAPGGFVGQTLGLPSDSPLSLAAAGVGPVMNWRGRIDLSAGPIELAALDVQTNSAAGGQLTLSGSVSPGLRWPDQLRNTLAGPYQVSATAMLSNEQTIRVSKASIQNRFTVLSMDGVVNLEEQEIDASAEITMEDEDAIADLLSFGGTTQLSLKTELTGNVARPFMRLTAQLDDATMGALTSPRLTANAALDASEGLDHPISLALDGLIEKLAVNSEDENPIDFEDVTWVTEATFDTSSRTLTLTQGDVTN